MDELGLNTTGIFTFLDYFFRQGHNFQVSGCLILFSIRDKGRKVLRMSRDFTHDRVLSEMKMDEHLPIVFVIWGLLLIAVLFHGHKLSVITILTMLRM